MRVDVTRQNKEVMKILELNIVECSALIDTGSCVNLITAKQYLQIGAPTIIKLHHYMDWEVLK